MVFKHPFARAVSFTVDVDPDQTLHNVMVVETDLVLHVLAPGHDKSKVDELLAAVAEFLRDHSQHVDRARVVPVGKAHTSWG
jgi:hypothetical protein